jgi:small multidrug resistance family-3 protein
MVVLKTLALFILTALAEITGCYLPYLWLKKGAPIWLLPLAACSLAAFVWLLTLHPHSGGRVYAAYGGVYIGVALVWLWLVDSVQPAVVDYVGAGVSVAGMLIIMFGPRGA